MRLTALLGEGTLALHSSSGGRWSPWLLPRPSSSGPSPGAGSLPPPRAADLCGTRRTCACVNPATCPVLKAPVQHPQAEAQRSVRAGQRGVRAQREQSGARLHGTRGPAVGRGAGRGIGNGSTLVLQAELREHSAPRRAQGSASSGCRNRTPQTGVKATDVYLPQSWRPGV